MPNISKSYRPEAEAASGHLVLLIGLSVLLAVFAGMFFVPIANLLIQDSIYQKVLSSILVSLCALLLPPIVLRGLFVAKRKPFYLRFTQPRLPVKKAGQVIVLLLLMYPAVSLLSWVMAQIPIPETLRPIQEAVEKEYLLLLEENRPIGIILIGIFIAVVAPFAEEFFFRGGLMGWFVSRSRHTHVWVWIVALTFALIHFEWTGLLSRFFMGILLGYTALYGGLPMAILLHSLNNLLVYVLYKTAGIDQDLLLGDPATATGTQLMLVSFATLITLPTLVYLLRKLKKTTTDL